MSVAQRIKEFYGHLGLKSVNKFSTEIDVRQSTMRDVLQKDSDKISTHILIAIKKRYPKCNLDWIMTGEGEMTMGQSPEVTQLTKELELTKRDIEALERVIKRKDNQISEFEKDVAHYKELLKSKDEQIEIADRTTESVRKQVESLKRQLALKNNMLESKDQNKEIS